MTRPIARSGPSAGERSGRRRAGRRPFTDSDRRPGGQPVGAPEPGRLVGQHHLDGTGGADRRELQDQALLDRTLAEAGVPAIVNFGEFCGAADQADNLSGTTGTRVLGGPVTSGGVLLAITINPAAVPSGAKLDIGVADTGSGHGISVEEIIKSGASSSCYPIAVKVTHPAGSSAGS
jgi:hypothetical protein